MSNVIRLKRSSVASVVPAPSSLVDGELALNLADRKLFAKDTGGNIFEIGGSAYAFLDSPAFTGVPTAPTAAPGTNTDQLSTTAFVKAAVDTAIAGLDFQKDVLDLQIDATLDPSVSPLMGDRYIVTDVSHRIPIEVITSGDEAALDDLLIAVGEALSADETLGGLAEILVILAPEVGAMPIEGAATVRHATVPVMVGYLVGNPLAEE